MDNEKLDALLRQRNILPPRSNLTERIITSAVVVPQKPKSGFYNWFQDILYEFNLPYPSYAIASILVLCFIIGFNIESNGENYDTDNSGNIQALMYEEDLL
ncbi:MAG: hypothetical protein K0R98_1726 [Rickettsiaceae bacterium]|jgi:hypothetical protein|nr:hypothetical protein [Rickettsiaceae bacterium]